MSKHSEAFKKASLAALAAAALSLSISTTAQAQTIAGSGPAANFNPNASMVNDRIAAQKVVKRKKIFMRKPGAIAKAKPGFAKAVTASRGGLPANLKQGINRLSGKSMRNVKVHYGSQQPSRIGARAYTNGTKIHIAPGQAKHLPHEAWHGVQQKQGRVRPTLRTNSVKSIKSAKSLRSAKSASSFARKAKSARTVAKGAQAAKVARHANTARKGLKAANTARKVGKAALMGTGVGAVVGLTAGLAGVDPVDLAVLKATNPAAYNRKMAALKKNPVKYMGNNIKNNTVKGLTNVGKATIKAGQTIGKAGQAVRKAHVNASRAVNKATQKAARDVGKATKTAANKVGCGVGNIFAKKKKKC